MKAESMMDFSFSYVILDNVLLLKNYKILSIFMHIVNFSRFSIIDKKYMRQRINIQHYFQIYDLYQMRHLVGLPLRDAGVCG